MVTLDRITFNECLDKGIDALLNNLLHAVEVASFEELDHKTDTLTFKDKYKTAKEHRLLSGTAANIIDSTFVILGLCSEMKRELLINGVSREKTNIKTRYLTLVNHENKLTTCLEDFSAILNETVKVLEDALFSPSRSFYNIKEDL